MVRYPRNGMSAIFLKLLDWIFPPHEDALRVRRMTISEILSVYTPHIVDGVYVLTAYRDKNIRALIHEAKFHGNTQAFTLLGTLFSSFLDSYKKPIDVVIPIPLSTSRMRARGLNQTHQMVLSQKKYTDLIDTNTLVRVRNTLPQTELDRDTRRTNMIDAFSVKNDKSIEGKHILLIDDVMTTGATLQAAKAALLQHSPASVTCVAFAH